MRRPYAKSQSFALLVGRVLLAFLFLLISATLYRHWDKQLSYIQSIGYAFPSLTMWAGVALSFIGSVFVVLGFRTRLGVFLLLLFLLAYHLILRNFWSPLVVERADHAWEIWKTVGLSGSLFVLWGSGPGNFAID